VIGSLRGTLADVRLDGAVLVDVGGVGYRVLVPPATVPALGTVGTTVALHTHLSVREDALTLYGFATADERACFEALVGTHGVGPSLALAVLSVHAPRALRRAVADDDVGALCLVAGVGRKTAARLLIELKDRLDVAGDADLAASPLASQEHGDDATLRPARAEVREALVALGYEAEEVRAALGGLPEGDDVATLLRAALAGLGRGR
jgi:Holliday junction DNA helicase RuvA